MGAAWLAQHMQWDFDDVDPVMPLSPFFRFDHAIKSKYLLPLGQETIRFSTTVRPTGRRGWVTTTVNPFSWLQVQSTVFSQGLKAPCAVSSAEVVLPLDNVTMQADDMLNRGLHNVQQGALGRTVLSSVRTQVLVGASTRDEPWIGVENDARISLSESKRPLRLRTRVTCSTDKQVLSCYPISSLCACAPYSRSQTAIAHTCCFLCGGCCFLLGYTPLARGFERNRAASSQSGCRRELTAGACAGAIFCGAVLAGFRVGGQTHVKGHSNAPKHHIHLLFNDASESFNNKISLSEIGFQDHVARRC